MSLLWITFIISIIASDSVSSAVVIRRRPISIQERVAHTTTAPTTARTTAAPIPEDVEETVDTRLSHLTLPSNATSIRSDITDTFSCAGRSYGYYADIDNDCQIFHVCLPVTYPDGKEQQLRWSFICPEETTFDQEAFTCVRTDEMTIDCTESERFYELNRILGVRDEAVTEEISTNELGSASNENVKLEDESNHENNQRFRVTPSSNSVRHTPQEGSHRSPIYSRRTTMSTDFISHPDSTEKSVQLTNNRLVDRLGETNRDKFDVTAAYENAFYTNRKDLTTTNDYDKFAYTTNSNDITANELTTIRNELNTRIVPDLYEMNENSKNTENNKAANEVVDTIKQLQNIFPSTDDDSRTKRFLFKADSIKNRQKLFDHLNKN